MPERIYKYRDVFEDQLIITIEGATKDTPLTEVDKRFEQLTGRKATERGIAVTWEDK